MKTVAQKHDWDCGVACVAMALRCSYDEALVKLGERTRKEGYLPHEIAAAVGEVTHRYEFSGSLERCIVQVILEPGGAPKHWIYVEDGIHCPHNHVRRWIDIHGFGDVVTITNQPSSNREG